ncbi:MAG TPA: K(+)-transporting ATPase subunit C [Tepidiformaceae bacterium]
MELASWKSELRPLVAVTIALIIITAVLYPLAVTGIGQAAFNRQANGSLIKVDGNDVGSSLIGQQFTGDQYFQGRPSAAGTGYDASNSSGSNLAPTSDKLINGIHDPADPSTSFDGLKDRATAFRQANGVDAGVLLPSDAVTASASGLDPHISPATAKLEVSRVAKARGASAAAIQQLVDQYTERPALGFVGQSRVNVLKLNIALDAQFPVSK